ncbi:MAG TPA: acyl-CoA dehydrogenase family protein [Acidimicrobiales bacterium]|nr:acyl-CoA dehydrogenase family protein [Acidimicrobiales bacterium]
MHLGLTPDQEFFQETTRKFLDARCSPAELRALAADPTGYRPDWWHQGAELGWTTPLVPEAGGGGSISGAGLADLSLAAFEFGRHAAPGPLIPTNVAAYTLGQSAPAESAPLAAWLERLLSGTATAAWLRADAPGMELGGAELSARTGLGGSVIISGRASVVEGGADAEVLLVTARSEQGRIHAVVDASTTGIRRRRLEGVDLTRRWARVELNDLTVPAEQILWADGPDLAERQLSVALCLQQAESVGALQAAFDMTLEWTANRYSFGRPLSSYQEIKHRMADMRMWLEASYAITVAAIDAFDAGQPDASELASAAKAYVGQFGPELVQDCVQIHGGIGVTFDHDLHLFLRRVTAGVPAYGSPAQHRRRLAGMVAQRVAAS